MRVLFCTGDTATGVNGINTWMTRLLPRLRAEGVTPELLVASPVPLERSASSPGFLREGVCCRWIRNDETTDRQTRAILGVLRSAPPDVFVPSHITPALHACRWARMAGIPSIGGIHNDDAQYAAILDRFAFGEPERRLSAVFCVSRELTERVKRRAPDGLQVEYLPYGIPIPETAASRPDGPMKVVYIGRLVEEQKRISETVLGLCWTAREVPGIDVEIYGSGPAQDTVIGIIAGHGQGLPIRFMGRVDVEEVPRILLRSHVMVLLSDYEGLPLALLEAMACGVVPVCCRIGGGVEELVEHGVTGLLVENREEALVRAIRDLRGQPALWQRLAQGARAKIEKDYDIRSSMRQWRCFLEAVRDRSPVRRPVCVPRRLDLPPPHPDLAETRQLPLRTRFRVAVAAALRAVRVRLGSVLCALRS